MIADAAHQVLAPVRWVRMRGMWERRTRVDQIKKAEEFASLHVKGAPVILYNAWDAGSAKAIIGAGAKAIATSSWSVAAALGYKDGEDLPLSLAEHVVRGIATTVNVPVTVDFEGGYSDDDQKLASNITKLLEIGVIGINFEDRVVKGTGLYGIDRQAKRIAAIRRAAEQRGISFFINARTDMFLGNGGDVEEALRRAHAYAAAGASGFFIPGVIDPALIQRIVEEVTLPVNVMVMDGVPSNDKLAKLGVSRVSYGPIPISRRWGRYRKRRPRSSDNPRLCPEDGRSLALGRQQVSSSAR
jgi:2-methylisocitrate lyase-like PEP mutase family enzyme